MKKAVHRQEPEEESLTIRIGELTHLCRVLRSAKRKRTVALHVDPDGGLRVLAPRKTSLSFIESFLHKRSAWIARRAEERKVVRKAPTYAEGDSLQYLGHECRLKIEHNAEWPQGCYLGVHYLTVNIRDTQQPTREAIRLEILLWLKRRSRFVLRKRLEYWSKRLKMPYRRVAITNPVRQWGSCSATNDIRLNWRLILAPVALIDYVIVHELCHTLEKNHGPLFWKIVEKAMPDFKQRRQMLRQNGQNFTLPD